MFNAFSRTEMLLGAEALEKLAKSRVAVFGLGGVGSFALEGLVRAGVGKLVLVDGDLVCVTNLNRQLIATSRTVGRPKAEAAAERVLEINPAAEVIAIGKFYKAENSEEFFRQRFDYVVDAIDDIDAKISLIVRAKRAGIPIISSMGMGNKVDPVRIEVADIFRTSVDPLAKIVRRKLREEGVDSLKVVYSREEPLKPAYPGQEGCEAKCPLRRGTWCGAAGKAHPPGSVSFVPSVAGMIIAGEVIKDLTGLGRS